MHPALVGLQRVDTRPERATRKRRAELAAPILPAITLQQPVAVLADQLLAVTLAVRRLAALAELAALPITAAQARVRAALVRRRVLPAMRAETVRNSTQRMAAAAAGQAVLEAHPAKRVEPVETTAAAVVVADQIQAVALRLALASKGSSSSPTRRQQRT
tara:strand:- start:321 stop:800 length:480 start_codon:yes stop_codon:yes gene_type:complete